MRPVSSLLELVKGAVETAGAVDLLGSYPYWDLSAFADDPETLDVDESDDATLEKVKNALWNYEFVENDGSLGVHNTGYAVGILQRSYKDMTGEDVSMDLRYE